MTWGEIKRQVMALCFEQDEADFEADYGAGLIDAANSCLHDLANTSARFHETLRVSIPVVKNLLSCARGGTFTHLDEDLVFYAEGKGETLAYTFDCDGAAQVKIGEREIECTAGGYRRYCGTVEASSVCIRFSGQSPYHIRNLAVYDRYPLPIPEWAPYARINCRQLCDQAGGRAFMKFDEKLPVTADGTPIADFAYEGDDTILIPVKYDGEICIPYRRYPQLLAQSAPDNTELDLDLAAQELMPYFIAGRVYMDYDVQKSIIYMNLYEQRKQETFNELPVHSQWTNYYGW